MMNSVRELRVSLAFLHGHGRCANLSWCNGVPLELSFHERVGPVGRGLPAARITIVRLLLQDSSPGVQLLSPSRRVRGSSGSLVERNSPWQHSLPASSFLRARFWSSVSKVVSVLLSTAAVKPHAFAKASAEPASRLFIKRQTVQVKWPLLGPAGYGNQGSRRTSKVGAETRSDQPVYWRGQERCFGSLCVSQKSLHRREFGVEPVGGLGSRRRRQRDVIAAIADAAAVASSHLIQLRLLVLYANPLVELMSATRPLPRVRSLSAGLYAHFPL